MGQKVKAGDKLITFDKALVESKGLCSDVILIALDNPALPALDFKTDAALRHALQDETRDAAVLIIAQRISTILHADQIVVLKDGEVVGLGTHGELMETCEVYRAIAESQMKGGE